SRICDRWRIAELRCEHRRGLPPVRHLRRANSQGRQLRGAAGPSADQIRAGDQLEDRDGARPQNLRQSPHPRRRGDRVKRRNFIALLGGAAAAWPLVARAQKTDRIRRIGVLMNTTAEDPLGQAGSAAFAQGLQQLGWEVGFNVRVDTRWGAGDTEAYRKYATELVALAPDVILATANSIVSALQQASRTVPIVFVTTIDPVGGGLVASLARPGGNATGFTSYEFSLNAKLLELLKEVAPGVT